MDCGLCGGCSLRHLGYEEYCQYKSFQVRNILQSITRHQFSFADPIFIDSSTRRRASFAFQRCKNGLILGFNAFHSHEIIDLDFCPQLTTLINRNLSFLRVLLFELCQYPHIIKRKGKIKTQYVEQGDLWITQADNGLDVVLEFNFPLTLEQREIIFQQVNTNSDIIRVSHRLSTQHKAETILQKYSPYIKAGKADIFLPAGTFLQPSREGQEKLTALVKHYIGNATGNIADLFCGAGTFSCPLAEIPERKILAVDSSSELLTAFQYSINKQMIVNIDIVNRNLFKYPLTENELEQFCAVVLDPPRAGAKEQVSVLAQTERGKRPTKLVYVSCNPQSFVRDANILQSGGYTLTEITMVDQFVYTQHAELVALFMDND